jgi:two-component system response regulator VicR
MRILVVDGEFQSRWVIAGWLSAFLNGVAVESAASADEALAAIEQRRPDLVLAAHPLPEVDGIELARRVKAKHNPPTVVVMTEQSNADFEAACAAAGADYCLEKRHLQARLLLFLQERFSLTVARQAVV